MGISNEQYSEIMRDYERTQRYNRDLDLANRDEVYSAIPELSEIDNAISDISTSAVIKSLNSTYDIHEANDRIQK
jgi:DNA replication protein DnaC